MHYFGKNNRKMFTFCKFYAFFSITFGHDAYKQGKPVSWLLQLPGLAFEIKRLISEKMN